MVLNPRVDNAPAGLADLQWNNSIASWVAVARGVVSFDLADGDDLAWVADGTAKPVQWYTTSFPQPGDPDPIYPGALSAFAILFSGVVASSALGSMSVYDEAAEVKVGVGPGLILPSETAFIHAWLWPSALTTVGNSNYTAEPPATSLMVAYEGSPIAPAVALRPGMISGVTPADAVVTWRFSLYALPQTAFGSARIRVPSPYCVPPFIAHGTNKGTHIFQGHAAYPVPQTQQMPFSRQFRSAPFDTVASATNPQIDARIFGGPWRGHMMGATDAGASTCDWKIQQLLQRVADPVVLGYTPAPLVEVSSSPSASLNTGPEALHDALRFTQFDETSGGTTEILVDSPGE